MKRQRVFVGELLGTALLLAAVVGSGIMGDRLAAGNTAVALLANSLATGAALVVLILTFGPICGAHFNPLVSWIAVSEGHLSVSEGLLRTVAQIVGAVGGVVLAHAMFGEPLLAVSMHVRSGWAQGIGEVVATFGLIGVIQSGVRTRPSTVPFAVGAYITSAYWFTSSTSFANPAVTLARTMTNTFTGIRPADAPAFLVAQVVGAGAATLLWRWLLPKTESGQ